MGKATGGLVQQGFCVRRAEVQNPTLVFQFNFSNKTSFCASISRPNAKPRTVMPHCRTTVTEQNFVTCETNYISKNKWTN